MLRRVVVDIVVHRLRGRKKALDACLLIEALCTSGRTVAVWVADPARAALFDEYLWTFSEPSFVPHAAWSPDQPDGGDPVVVLSGDPQKPPEAAVLVLLDRLPDASFASSFEEVHELVTSDPADDGWAEFWRAAGYEPAEEDGVSAGRR